MTTPVAPMDKFAPEEIFAFLTDPDVRADPHPLYHRLRSLDPVHHSLLNYTVVSRYADVVSLLRDPRLSSDERNHHTYDPAKVRTGEFSRLFNNLLLFLDVPDHTRLRALVQKAFTRRVVEDMRSRIEAVVAQVLKPLSESTSFDLIADFAYPVPVIVICELLGVPVEDRERFHGWARDLATRFEIQPLRTPESEARGDAATQALRHYFDELIDARRGNLGADLLSELIAAEEEGDRLTHDELFATCALLLIAGHETTANLVGNGVLALLRHPAEINRLRQEPTLIRSGVEELLRYDGPVQIAQRITLDAVEVDGKTTPKGEGFILLIAAANRDPARFPEPDRLDIDRPDNQHVAFSAGGHFCLGAPLARLEAQIMITRLLEAFPKLSLAAEPAWRESFVLRGLKSLEVTSG